MYYLIFVFLMAFTHVKLNMILRNNYANRIRTSRILFKISFTNKLISERTCLYSLLVIQYQMILKFHTCQTIVFRAIVCGLTILKCINKICIKFKLHFVSVQPINNSVVFYKNFFNVNFKCTVNIVFRCNSNIH
jgi:hypothetical protein